MKVKLLTPDNNKLYSGSTIDLTRLPAVGEYLILDTNEPWLLVEVVAHTQYKDAQWEAEIWAKPVKNTEVTKPLLEALKTSEPRTRVIDTRPNPNKGWD